MNAAAAQSPLLLVADYDAETRATVSGFMEARGYDVKTAADADTAMDWLRSRRIDVLVSDLAMRGGGLELLSFTRAAAPATRSIAIAASPTPHDKDTAMRLGAVRVLAKPLSLHELADAVGLARDEEGFHGWMHRMSLVDVLQMYHHTAQSLVIRISSELDGSIAIRHGQLVHAECGGRVGVEAFVALLGARRGLLETTAIGEVPRTIEGSFDRVLLDGLRALDEQRRGPSEPPPVLPRTSTADGWFDESLPPDPLDRDALVAWIAEHAPGAGLWRVDPDAGILERLDAPGSHPEHEIAGTLGSIGWAYELAQLAGGAWTRVELASGATAVALVRAGGVTLAFARLITGDAVQRRFRVEAARLAGWLARELGGAR